MPHRSDSLLISPIPGALRPSEPPADLATIGGKAPVWGRKARRNENYVK